MTNRIALALLLAPIAACKCGPDLNGITENLTCTWWDAGAIGVGYVEHSGKAAIVLTAGGQASVEINNIELFDDGGGFTWDDGGALTPDGGGVVPVGATQIIDFRFDPKRPGDDNAFVVINSDNGSLVCDLVGVGIDECAAINLDGGCDAGIDTCTGTCTNGACVWPGSSSTCVDGTQCITNGTCNGAGGCAGPSSCVPTGTCTNNNGSYTGEIATNPDGTGTCNPSSNPNTPGQCLYNMSTEACDCGCGTLPNGNLGCLYNWTLDPTSPDGGRFGSVWASQAGDAWATQSNGGRQGNTIGQVFYERVNGTWTQQATLPLGSNPLSGAGGSVALTGDQAGNVFGASACSSQDTLFDIMGTSTPTGDCADAGVWKWSSGTASFEPLAPPAFTNGCGNVFDFAQTYPVMLGGTVAAMLDSDPCGPEILTEGSGQFGIIGGSQLEVMCSATGALWGMSSSDAYIAWACGGSGGGGGIWHYTGNHLSTTPDFPFTPPDNAAAMAGTSDTDIWAVGTQRWHNNGSGWTLGTPPPAGEPDESLWSVGDGTYFAAGNYPGVYHYANNAWTLECLAPGYTGNDPSVSQVAGDTSDDFYAATQQGIFKRLP